MNQAAPRHTIELRLAALSTWEAFSRNAIPFIIASAIVVVLVPLTFSILTGPLMVGLIHMSNRAITGDQVDIGDLWLGFQRIGRPIIAWIMIAVSVSLGFALLVLPGIVLSLLWIYSFWFIATTDMLPSESLKTSWRVVRVNLPSTILLGLLLVLINALGSFLVVGIFASLPLSVLLVSASFQQLNPKPT